MNNEASNQQHPVNYGQRRRLMKSKITRRIMLQYFLSLAGFVCILFFLLIFGWNIASSITWYSDQPLYRILSWVKDYIVLVIGFLLLCGWIIMSYYFIARPLRYLDEIIAAAERLASPTDEPILLPDAMKYVQDELNLVREQALKNARIAKEAEQRKNDMIVYLAHDLKTPLTSVIGYLTLLRDEPQISPELRAKYTGIALDKAQRLEELVNDFFDITRFNLTTLTLEPERINLSRMLEQITSEFYPILAEKELTFDASIQPDIQLLCDPDKLERVFDNLIRNAVNYSYSGTVIALALEKQEQNVCLRIQNHGKTISPEKLSHIFEQFFRVDSSRSSATGGAGLGLAIAKEIVELHGGKIFAESADESITFTVFLPLR